MVDSKSAVLEYLNYRPESVVGLQCSGSDSAYWRRICEEAGLDESLVDPSVDMRGRVTCSVRLATSTLQICLKKQSPYLLVLDHVTDPRNLGAIVRSAGFFGVEWVIAPRRRQVLLTPASVATAMGGFAKVNLVTIGNVGDCVKELQECGYQAVAAGLGGTALKRWEVPPKLALVLGAEDKGVSPKVLGLCNQTITIFPPETSLDSLNVSVAAGVFLNHILGL